MSLNNWSLVLFFSTFIFYMFVYFAMFSKPRVITFIFTLMSWVLSMTTKLVYGIATDQIGFILLFALDLFMVFLVFIIAGRYINDNQDYQRG